MRSLLIMLWLSIFSIFFSKDTATSQQTPSSSIEDLRVYSDSEMQIFVGFQISSDRLVKLSYCQILLMRNQLAIEECKNIKINLKRIPNEVSITESTRNK